MNHPTKAQEFFYPEKFSEIEDYWMEYGSLSVNVGKRGSSY